MCKSKTTVNDPVDVETCSAASSGPRDDADGLLPTTRRAKSGDGHTRGISLGDMQMKHLKHSETLGKITARIGLTSAYQTGRLDSVNEKL